MGHIADSVQPTKLTSARETRNFPISPIPVPYEASKTPRKARADLLYLSKINNASILFVDFSRLYEVVFEYI